MVRLFSELQVALVVFLTHLAPGDRRQDRAAGLLRVGAVGIAAARRQVVDISKLRSTASPASRSPSSLIPGVSISIAPPSSRTSWRRAVACVPRPVPLMDFVSKASRPMRRLMSVVLPTPDDPSRQYVRPGANSRRNSSIPAPVTLLSDRIPAATPDS